MKPDFFKNLPSEIITEIFLRLPAVSIPISKCVCKRWLHLLESDDDFVESHFARSAPALVALVNSNRLKVFELEAELDPDLESYDPLIQYDFPYRPRELNTSVNGLLFLRLYVLLCVCNPITREIIKLDLPTDPQLVTSELCAYGFGASKVSGQYKVVCIQWKPDHELECHVYTLGTGSWRRLEGNPCRYQFRSGAFVNGNIHWLAIIGEASWISCFDVETECFSFFKPPPHHARGLPFTRGRSLCALSGRLWFCEEAFEYEDDGGRGELTIWIMKEYGVDESWSLAYVIPLVDNETFLVDPVRVFENGDLLILLEGCASHLFYYSNKNKTMQRIDLFGGGKASDSVDCGIFTPTLVSLKTLGLGVENVTSF